MIVWEYGKKVIPQTKKSFRAMANSVEEFIKIPATLPKEWLEITGYKHHEKCPYFGVYYCGSKATWINGWGASQTFSYFAYSNTIEHFAIALYLLDADLGSGDYPATHMLIMNCANPEAIELYVAPWDEGMKFLKSVAPELPKKTLTPEEMEQLRQEYEQIISSEQMQRQLGLFEFFRGPSQEQYDLTLQIIQHLNSFICVDLFKQYAEAGKTNYEAVSKLRDMINAISRAETEYELNN